MMIPDSAEVLCYPQAAYPELVKKLGRYEINDWDPGKIGATFSSLTSSFDGVIKRMARLTEERKNATLTLLRRIK